MLALSLVAAAVVAPLVFAQDVTVTLGLQAIKAHFQQSALVSDLFTSSPFEPSALVTLTFPGVGELQPGQNLTKEQVAPVPTVTVKSSSPLSGNYTLAMLDAGIVGEKNPQTRHWLVNGVRVSSSGSVTNASAVEITGYAGPGPAAGSGPHRYVIVLHNQPDTFHAPPDLSTPGVPVGTIVWSEYVNQTSLGSLIGATYFTVEEGPRTVSISATSPVVTSTLPGAVSSSSGSKTSTGPASTGTTTNTNSAITLSTGGHVVAIAFLSTLLCINFSSLLVVL